MSVSTGFADEEDYGYRCSRVLGIKLSDGSVLCCKFFIFYVEICLVLDIFTSRRSIRRGWTAIKGYNVHLCLLIAEKTMKESNCMTTIKKIWNIVSSALVVLMVLCAVFLMGSRLIGFRCFNVISPSMEPKYGVGDLIYVKEVNPATIKEGDVITFLVNEDLVVGTHRVVRVDAENQRFYTKGDANEIEDQNPVHFNNVIGVPRFAVPKLGYVSDFIQNPPGMYITIGVGILLILLVFIPDMIGKKKEEENSQAAAVQTKIDATSEENERLKAEIKQLKAETAVHFSSGEMSQLSAEKNREKSE